MAFEPQHSSWSSSSGPGSDVVMSCRVRIARNIAGFRFVNQASVAHCQEILRLARSVLLTDDIDDGMIWVDLNASTDRDRRLLVERHLISHNLAESAGPRAVAISSDETLSVMVNEEDHLRMQVLTSGLNLREAFVRINEVDDAIESRVEYAFSPRWGYLTACPTNVGTGIRFSVMLHLPALKITSEIDRVRRAAKDLHLAVRGYYGEGSDSAGDFYQISNQITLGHSEVDILESFQNQILPKIIEYEQEARQALMRKNSVLLDDRVQRSLAVLRHARLLGVEEAMKLLSRVRLGAYLGRLDGIDVQTVNQLFLLVQPTHLQANVGEHLSGDELREARATLVRQKLR